MDIRLTPEQVEALRQIDTCALANAIEVFGVRLRIAVCRSPEFSAEKLRASIEKYKSNSPDPQTSEVGDEIKN